jgi:RAB6A-GEF complex partner protein 1
MGGQSGALQVVVWLGALDMKTGWTRTGMYHALWSCVFCWYSIGERRFQDTFMSGVKELFWAPGDFELVVLAHTNPDSTYA